MQQGRLLLVTEYFWPDQVSTGRLLGELIEEIEKKEPSLKVTVITSNRLYRGPQGHHLPREEQRGNQTIIRLTSHRTGKDRFLRRLWSDILFSIQSAHTLLHHNYDCLMVVTNPPLMPFVLALVNRLRGKPLIYLIHDLFPDVAVALGQWRSGSVFVRLLARWQKRNLQVANKVIVLGRCMKDHLIQRYGVRPEAVEVIHNWFTVRGIDGSHPAGSNVTDGFNVVYSGNLGQFQDFDTILDAAELLKGYPGIRFHIVGDGARREYLEDEVRRRGMNNIQMQPFLSDKEFAAMLAQTHLGLVTLEPQLEGLGVPSKTYNLLAMGIPLLAVLGPQSEVSRIVTEQGCGFQVDPGNAHSAARFILDVYRSPQHHAQMAARARTYAVTQASVQAVADSYLGVFRQFMTLE